MASVTEYLELLQKLTQKNLDILKGLNDAFLTKQDHLNVKVDLTNYVIPSFMSLENRINSLQENFYNLVHAPETGEAYFDFDGNTRSIEVRSYNTVPNSLTLDNVSTFNVETNNIFKDFLTPNPYMHFNVLSLPNDVTSVIVKKVIPKNPKLIDIFKSNLIQLISTDSNLPNVYSASNQYPYKDLYKILSVYNKDEDYIEYDKIIKLPIRKNIGSGVYAIEEITKNITDENLDQYITVKIRTDMKGSEYMNRLYYRLFDETIERPLAVGDEMTSYDGKTKFLITGILENTNSIILKIENGEYLNLAGSGITDEKYINEMSKLRFYSPVEFENDKYVNVSLEEDQYIYVAIAALNDRMNILSPWGTGVIVNTFELTNGGGNFKDFYNANVKNIGDTLNEISSIMYNTVTKFSKSDFNKLSTIKPILNQDNILVTQINLHLNDNKTIKEIRSLYSQKLTYNTRLAEIQTKIDNLNKQLSETSFDDVVNTRASITDQLTALNQEKNETITAITKVINSIALAANNSEIPIEDAKFRIRGFFDYKNFANRLQLNGLNNIDESHIIGIKVQYRYKNSSRPLGESLSINDKFLFSDWNNMTFTPRLKHPTYDNGYKFVQEIDNSNLNEPSFNQIDIPITLGENVDIKLKVIYDFGYPFIQTTSEWSDILSIPFPKELLKTVQITTIIEENNNDIETNRFNNILQEKGIPEHVQDKITDQDITYFHKPENIASGFYTAERRIIPLKDKLAEFDNNINTLLNEITGDAATGLIATVEIGGRSLTLLAYQINNIALESYDSFISKIDQKGILAEGGYNFNNGTISVVLNVKLTNTLNRVIKLYPLFPGDRSIDISKIRYSKFDKADYAYNSAKGVWMKLLTSDNLYDKKLQTANQFVTFRMLNATSGQRYYFTDDFSELYKKSDKLTADHNIELPTGVVGAAMYPFLTNTNALCINGDSAYSFLPLNTGESVSIPLIFEYNLSDKTLQHISKTMAFDVRTSLYSEPLSFNIKVTAKKTNSMLDRIAITDKKLDVVKYNTVIAN